MSNNQLALLIALILSPILLAQGFWIFKDARKRNDKFCWLWGIFCLLNTPTNLITYLIVTRIIIDKYVKNKK